MQRLRTKETLHGLLQVRLLSPEAKSGSCKGRIPNRRSRTRKALLNDSENEGQALVSSRAWEAPQGSHSYCMAELEGSTEGSTRMICRADPGRYQAETRIPFHGPKNSSNNNSGGD